MKERQAIFLRYNHLIDMDDYTVSQWNEIVSLAERIKTNPEEYSEMCRGKIMATLFYEPSTRTQMSFQAAMIRLGGSIIGFDNPGNSSVAKGENLKDTIKIVSTYSDILVMRHNQEGSAKAAALCADCHVINAGDGGHLHPTQTLTDLLTLKSELGRLDNLTVGLCGDLKYGRTVHSLVKALSCYPNNKFVLISTPALALPSYVKEFIKSHNSSFIEVKTIDECIGKLDMLYMTRIQRERFDSDEEYERQKNVYCLTKAKMSYAKKDMIVMHPLPRVNEIEVAVDDDPRAAYFRQANNGMYVRMALILTTMNLTPKVKPLLLGEIHNEICCTNPKCVTQTEKYLPHSFLRYGDILICEYCDERMLLH
ncbi:MAG TPA: aspartate carbamoyltransferase [Ruminococcaceae bacterium]|nr:aspartate carbamoyltransferase [Oscillospiraceae bacterium]